MKRDFMWSLQRYSQFSCEHYAENLFRSLDPRFKPSVFLVGILVDDKVDRHPICLEPNDCGYSVECFADVKELAEQLQKVDEENGVFVSDPRSAQMIAKRVTDNSYVRAIQNILGSRDYYKENEYYVTSPAFIEGFQVFAVLVLDKNALARHYSLTKQIEGQFSRFPISRSFIESVVEVFLNECTHALKESNGSAQEIKMASDELLRKAGSAFMKTVGWAGGGLEGTAIYNTCNDISALKYEGAVGIGNMIIAPKNHPNVKLTLELAEPINIRNHRTVRKFLELSNNSTSIVSDAVKIYGLGEIRGKYNPRDENLFVVHFSNHLKWELLHDNNSMMVVEYREPALPKEKINRDKFYTDIPRVFAGITNEQINSLWEIAIEATKQKHGTMLVISDDAKNEADRLGQQCFVVNPFKLTDEKIQQITAIDGAVLVDRSSACYAIGVILDGLATDKGNPARGARYNSAIRYYESARSKTSLAIVIISEDGMINVIPDLMPQVKHSIIVNSIDEFKKIYDTETLDMKSYFRLINFLEEHKFYLSNEECEIINTCRKNIESKFDGEFGPVRFQRNDIVSNKEMNDSYYVVEDS